MRVTIDYDGVGFLSKFKAVVGWLTLKAISRGNVYGRKSAYEGYHLKCHRLGISFRVSLLVRVLLLDDVHRILFDVQRLKKPKQCLWSIKDGKKAGDWSRCLKKVLF